MINGLNCRKYGHFFYEKNSYNDDWQIKNLLDKHHTMTFIMLNKSNEIRPYNLFALAEINKGKYNDESPSRYYAISKYDMKLIIYLAKDLPGGNKFDKSIREYFREYR